MFTILVVDDDKNTRRLMRAVLESDHFQVFTATDGEQALDVLEKEHIDLIVLDIMMPNMDGYAFMREIREADMDLPVLMVSAKQLTEDRKKGFQLGIDDYMTKPIDDEEFLLHIHALLRRAKAVNDRKLVIGEVVLDYDSYTVTGHGQQFDLPKKEFQLLYRLLSEPGRIFTRIQLMDEIWGMESDTGWETVTVHIGRLRKRFQDWEEFEIVSIRGLGYKAVKNV